LPLSPRLGWIGVDVGTHTVKLAQAVRDGAGVRLHRAAVIQRSTAWSSDDALALEQPITSFSELREALECGGFVGRDAICSLPMNVCQLRALNVPPGSQRERRTMIADELADDWAELRQPMDFDFWELEPGRGEKGSEGFNVSVLAASRLWIDQLHRDCRRNGLDCWALDGAPLAMARAVSLAGGLAGGRRVLAVDWGYSNTTACVVGDDRPLYSRRIHDCAFGKVLEAIMRLFDATLDEAQYLAESQGLAAPQDDNLEDFGVQRSADVTPDGTVERPATTWVDDHKTQTAITDAAESSLHELTRQLGRTLEFTAAQRRQLHPTAIWLLGGGASMRNVGPYLKHALALPVHIWNVVPDKAPIPCAAGHRSAIFGGAVALSASIWRAA
jgi:type IV pilus assembly protein PilM